MFSTNSLIQRNTVSAWKISRSMLQCLTGVLMLESVIGDISANAPFLVANRQVESELPVFKRSSCTTKSALNALQQKQMLKAHNQVRRNVTPRPYTALADLTWDDGLASRAQELADSCRYAHTLLDDCSGVSMGQNLAYYGSKTYIPKDDITGHVKRWADEVQFYDLESNTCSDVCGHYTQIVWDETTKVGCGYKQCTKLYNIDGSLREDFSKGVAWYMVCDYSSAGNYKGEKPYETKYIELKNAQGGDCTNWIYKHCNDVTYGRWAKTVCALTCSNI